MKARTKAVDFSQKVKEEIQARDNYKCVLCGEPVSAMPNAHNKRRSHGGLGIKENGLNLCLECHNKFDSGDKVLACAVQDYLDWKHPYITDEMITYKRD